MEHISVREPLAIDARLAELGQLRPGWLDGKGVPLSPGDLAWLAEAFAVDYADDLPTPYLFPTPEGHVLAEWALKPWSPSLEIDPAAKRGTWHALNLETDEESARKLDLTNADDWT